MSAAAEYWWIAIPAKIALAYWFFGVVQKWNAEEKRKEEQELRARGIDPEAQAFEQRKQEIIAKAMKRSK